MSWKYRVVETGFEDPDQLLPHPSNPRFHSTAQKQFMEAIFDEVGWIDEIIVNRRTGYMLNGHMRSDISMKKGEQVPVKYVDLSEEEELKVLATFDQIGAMAARDKAIAADLTSRIQTDSDKLKLFLKSVTPMPDLPGAPEGSSYANHIKGMAARYGGASGHTLLLSYDQESYQELMAILPRAKAALGVETNSEVVQTLLLQFDAEIGDEE